MWEVWGWKFGWFSRKCSVVPEIFEERKLEYHLFYVKFMPFLRIIFIGWHYRNLVTNVGKFFDYLLKVFIKVLFLFIFILNYLYSKTIWTIIQKLIQKTIRADFKAFKPTTCMFRKLKLIYRILGEIKRSFIRILWKKLQIAFHEMFEKASEKYSCFWTKENYFKSKILKWFQIFRIKEIFERFLVTWMNLFRVTMEFIVISDIIHNS